MQSSFLSRLTFGAQGRWESSVFPLLLMMTTPYFVLALWMTATQFDGSFASFFQQMSSTSWVDDFFVPLWSSPSKFGFQVIFAFLLWAVVMTSVLPGPKNHGPPTPSGHVPIYNDNGFLYYLVTISSFGVLTYILKTQYGISPTLIYDRWGEMIGSLNTFALVFCLCLLLKGHVAPSPGAHGSSGNVIFDYYWGLELYPRVLNVDIKQITNCRFGMTAWPLLILIHGLKSFESHGKFIDSIWISVGLQLIYISKFFWWEGGYMRTLDIILDKAGYYICWGCLVFVPGFYASPTLYLVSHPVELGPQLSAAIVALGLVAIWANYASDAQKDSARLKDGDVQIWGRKAKVIRAKLVATGGGDKRESLLLVSGFWSLARHFNYFAEIALAFSWSVPAFFHHLYPFCYVIFLTVLLVHRSFRDERKCRQKYGQFWTQYCKEVPFRIVPYVF